MTGLLQALEAKCAGLRTDSVIMTDKLATVLETAIAGKLGKLDDLTAVEAALRATLGL